MLRNFCSQCLLLQENDYLIIDALLLLIYYSFHLFVGATTLSRLWWWILNILISLSTSILNVKRMGSKFTSPSIMSIGHILPIHFYERLREYTSVIEDALLFLHYFQVNNVLLWIFDCPQYRQCVSRSRLPLIPIDLFSPCHSHGSDSSQSLEAIWRL